MTHTSQNRFARLALFSLMAIISITTLSHAQSCVAPTAIAEQARIQQEITNTWNLLSPVAIIALLISFSIAALIFMLGTAAKQDKIRNFGIGEIYEAISTAIIIGFFYLFVALFVTAIPQHLLSAIIPGPPPTSPYVSALTGLCGTITQLQTLYDCLYQSQDPNCFIQFAGTPRPSPAFVDLYYLLSQTVSLQAGGLPINGALIAGAIDAVKIIPSLNQLVPLQVAFGFLMTGIFLLWGLYYLMLFFSYISPLFISAGIIFRALFPTRAFGGIMIAMGMAFYLVAPTLIAFLYSPNNPFAPTVQICPSGSTQLYCNPSFAYLNSALASLWLTMLFYPILTLAITYVFISQISKFIGASSQGMGRLRVGFI